MGRASPPETPCSLSLPPELWVELPLCFQQRPSSLLEQGTFPGLTFSALSGLAAPTGREIPWLFHAWHAVLPSAVPRVGLRVWGAPRWSGTLTRPFSCLPELPGSTTVKGYIHRAETDACHFRSVSPGFRSSTGSSAATQTGSFPQPLVLSQESCSALRRVRDGAGYVGNTGGSWRLSIWHSLEQDSKWGSHH